MLNRTTTERAPRSGHRTSTLLALTILLGGCGGASESASPTSAAALPSAPIPAGATTPPPSEVVLLEPGDGPRRILRFAYPDGAEASGTMEMHMAVSIRMGDAPDVPPTPMPTVVLEMDAGPLRRYPDGSVVYSYRYGAVEVRATDDPHQEAVAATSRRLLEPLVGMRGECGFSARGEILYVHSEIPEDLDAQVAETMRNTEKAISQLMPPLPEQPVGVGAKWSTRSPVETAAIRFVQRTTYRLLSLDGDRIELDVTVEQEAPVPQALPAPQPGVDVSLTHFEGSGAGRSSFSLTDLWQSSRSTYANVSESLVRAQGREIATRMEMTIAIQVEMANRPTP